MLEQVYGFISALVVGMVLWYLDKKQRDARHNKEMDKLNAEYNLAVYERESLKKEKIETDLKLNFINRILDLEFINEIGEAVNRIFEKTKAERFLILIAKNGKIDFNVVSVVFEQHKKTEWRIMEAHGKVIQQTMFGSQVCLVGI